MLADEWHLPPWVIERRAPAVWVERWEALQAARLAARPKQIAVGQTQIAMGQTQTTADGARRTRVV